MVLDKFPNLHVTVNSSTSNVISILLLLLLFSWVNDSSNVHSWPVYFKVAREVLLAKRQNN